MEILTAEQMRRVDRRAVEEHGIPTLELMEAAGRGVAERLRADRPGLASQHLLVLCGKGNNGGDGLVAARHLARAGLRPRVLVLAGPGELAPDAAVQLARARALGLDVTHVTDEAAWREAARLESAPLVLDALLGTGIRGGARGLPAAAIASLETARAEVVAVDLPSGLDADSGAIEGPAVTAAATYTLCRPKRCLALDPAAHRCGRFTVVGIGIPDAAVEAEGATLRWTDAAEAARLLPRRAHDAHKGSVGHLLVVAGSAGKSGAAVLVARGALRSGVGLVTVACPASARPLVAVQQAEAMTEAVAEGPGGGLAEDAAAPLLALARGRDALAVGPGLGTAADTVAAIRRLMAERDVPAVLDADGLNAFAGEPERLAGGRAPLVLTPHPGEAARLRGVDTASIQADRLAAALALARETGAVVVLKGARTVVGSPDGRAAVNGSGNPGMATAGTGDVLTGVVGAWLARGLVPFDAARLAVFVHGDAGDRAAADLGADGILASDVAARVPLALRALAAGAA